jgi:hypothetical protein
MTHAEDCAALRRLFEGSKPPATDPAGRVPSDEELRSLRGRADGRGSRSLWVVVGGAKL